MSLRPGVFISHGDEETRFADREDSKPGLSEHEPGLLATPKDRVWDISHANPERSGRSRQTGSSANSGMLQLWKRDQD
ncbi:hypothetical protein LDENG_00100300 [Lucifuga dentata]|nr:hypothetical protein LDENG_00100300 [Lucifuga dentata]